MASANGGVAMPSYNIRYVVLLLLSIIATNTYELF